MNLQFVQKIIKNVGVSPTIIKRGLEIYKNNVLVDLIGSDRFEITPLGVQFKSESFALSSTGTDNITAKLVMADNNATMLSTSAPVSIKTFVSDDTLNGGAGNDILDGGFGADNMYGGAGNDTYYVDNVGDKVYETTTATSGLDSGGKDLVNSSISYTLGNFVEDLTLTGTANLNGTGNTLNNTITGNAGNNIINGGAGNDTMIGGKGNDTYYVNSFLDKVVEKTNEGTDTVYSSIGYKLSSNVENLILTGNTNIAGSGNELANEIIGNSGSNYLFGYNGNDILNGKLGNDILVGGAGKDNFVFDTTLNATTNKDTIKDFNVADDTISLENAIFAKLTATGLLNSANFVSTTDGKAKDSNDYIVYNKTNGQLFYDADGNGSGASVLFAVVENKANLTNADFTVI